MDTGSRSMNTRRTIVITNLTQNLGSDVCAALPDLHAFTGCDFTAEFMWKGKSWPYDIMVSDASFLTAFRSLGKSENVDAEVYTTVPKCVCTMYGQPKCSDVDAT